MVAPVSRPATPKRPAAARRGGGAAVDDDSAPPKEPLGRVHLTLRAMDVLIPELAKAAKSAADRKVLRRNTRGRGGACGRLALGAIAPRCSRGCRAIAVRRRALVATS